MFCVHVQSACSAFMLGVHVLPSCSYFMFCTMFWGHVVIISFAFMFGVHVLRWCCEFMFCTMLWVHVFFTCSESMFCVHVRSLCSALMLGVHVLRSCSKFMFFTMFWVHVCITCFAFMFRVHVQSPCSFDCYIKMLHILSFFSNWLLPRYPRHSLFWDCCISTSRASWLLCQYLVHTKEISLVSLIPQLLAHFSYRKARVFAPFSIIIMLNCSSISALFSLLFNSKVTLVSRTFVGVHYIQFLGNQQQVRGFH